MPCTALRFVALALLGAGLPAAGGAQQTSAPAATAAADSGVVHTVRKGDTLWDLARTYLSDPFAWPVIHRLNGDVVKDPHWIYPGEKIRIVAGERPTSAASGVAVVGNVTVSEPAPYVEPDTVTEEAVESEDRIAFGVTRSTVASGAVPMAARLAEPVVRQGDYLSAPYVSAEGGPGGGTIVSAADPVAVYGNEPRWLQVYETVYLTLPAGSDVSTGAQYVIYTLGERIWQLGQLVVPTGVVRVESAEPGLAVQARIVKQFQPIAIGQRLLPFDTLAIGSTPPRPTSDGARTEVVWANDDPVPTVNDFVVLRAPSAGSMQPGDEVTLLRPMTREGGVAVPEGALARARVVRSGVGSVTAIIDAQAHPTVQVGTPGRVTARMP
ncbi:MAG TPA: LysM peptidoglycan-binding domain-containing protein [Gemmatimonadaceae bacterium]|nr:LysM peptidoglycan-binding domain-containing protein [Gemmatimonadaceae bacterium]